MTMYLYKVITINLVFLNVCSSNSAVLKRNKKQGGKIISQWQPCGIKMCAKYCSREKRCKSFNYEQSQLVCELLAVEDVTDITTVYGYQHSDISTWDQKIASSCENHNCTDEERCVPLQNGNNICVKIGCTGSQYTYQASSGLCYHVYDESMRWDDALAFCENKTSRLIVLNTEAKINSFDPGPYNSSSVFIGLSDNDVEGTFKWVDGSPFNINVSWSGENPNNIDSNYPNQDANCVRMKYKQWYDDYCGRKRNFACERPDLSLLEL